MNEEFKLKLLALYPEYDKVTGPYLRKDGRKHVVFNNTWLSKGNKNKLRTVSWPKVLVEVRENRRLLNNETVDHDDEDFTNDHIDNLKILTRIENIKKSFNANPERATEWFFGICSICNKEFMKQMRYIRGNNIVKGKAGPFCSKSCAGKYSRDIQLGRIAQLVEAKDLSSFK
jgi:hypothetical protein